LRFIITRPESSKRKLEDLTVSVLKPRKEPLPLGWEQLDEDPITYFNHGTQELTLNYPRQEYNNVDDF